MSSKIKSKVKTELYFNKIETGIICNLKINLVFVKYYSLDFEIGSQINLIT